MIHCPHMDDLGQPGVIASVTAITRCPACLAGYARGDAETLIQSEDEYLMHAKCSACRAFMLIKIRLAEHAVLLEEIRTDLNGTEVVRTMDRDVVSLDDVLDIYVALQDFESFMDEILIQL